MEIPEPLEDAIDNVVAHHLATHLGDRGLLLTHGDLAVAEAKTARLGQRLLTCVLQQCYPMLRSGEAAAIEFDRESDVARIGAALAFGAVTSTVLASRPRGSERLAGSRELLCGTFNLGIGLIDGLCDGDAQTGERLLHHIRAADLDGAAHGRRATGWLSAGLPHPMMTNPTVAFTVNVSRRFSIHFTMCIRMGTARMCVGSRGASCTSRSNRSLSRSVGRGCLRRVCG